MKKAALLATAMLFMGLLVPNAYASGKLSARVAQRLKASAAEVWAAVGDFATPNTWHPAVVSEQVQGTGQKPGDTRLLTLGDGGKITERLVSRSPARMRYTYVIVESPLPVQNYRSTIRVISHGKHACTFVWSSRFDPKQGVSDKDAKAAIVGVYKAGAEALLKKFK
jgi:hypothetical protein